jgi:hypothetical protein
MSDLVPFDKNSYVAFDGLSIRDIIVSRLNQTKIFTDQNYQGSNLSAFIDIISYTFNTLLFYLNKTSSESMFSEAQLYENMNRIVKLLNYKPTGRLGQNVPFSISATYNLDKGNYFIPRYSYINVGGTYFSINQDISFSKLNTGNVDISDVNNNYLLYQGLFKEYPLYTAAGIDNEVIYLALNDNVYIDHFNIFVYVKPKNATAWQKWTNVSDLFLYKSTDNVYTTRFNENQRYEISFGDDVNGNKLNEGDQVAIYYLQIDENAPTLATGALQNQTIVSFNSTQYQSILSDTSSNYNHGLNNQQLAYLNFNNTYPSNSYSDYESVDDIRKNAPNSFRSQFRLVTSNDYDSYIRSTFSNILADTYIVNNDDYLRGHIRYLYNIGLDSPQKENGILFNQVKFSNSCNFNNIYVYAVPKNEDQDFLAPSQKELIIDGLDQIKTIASNIVVIDPVYMYLDFYSKNPVSSSISLDDLKNCKLRIIKSKNTNRASSAILSDVKNIFLNYFNHKVSKLGQVIDLYQLTSDIIGIDGIDNVQTYRSDSDTYVNGISILLWNDLYPTNDASVHTQNVTLGFYQYPVFNNIANITSRIEIVEPTGSIKIVDF